jgi:predicted ester cyclase
MAIEQNREIALQFFERVINARDLGLARQIVHPDFVDHDAPPPGGRGIDAFFAFAAMVTGAFPDLVVTVEDVIAEADRVAVRVTVRGTHQGVLLGRIEPTGRAATWTGIDILRIENGQIAERWSQRDIAGLLEQLGVGQ